MHLPGVPPPVAGSLVPMDLGKLLKGLERAYIDAALEQTRGNRQRAAALLGLQRTTLVEKLRRRAGRAAAAAGDSGEGSSEGEPSADVAE